MLTVTMADSMKKSVISQAIVVDDILARGLRFQKLSMWVDHSLTVRLVMFSAIISFTKEDRINSYPGANDSDCPASVWRDERSCL